MLAIRGDDDRRDRIANPTIFGRRSAGCLAKRRHSLGRCNKALENAGAWQAAGRKDETGTADPEQIVLFGVEFGDDGSAPARSSVLGCTSGNDEHLVA